MTLNLAFKNTTADYTGTGAGLAGRLTSAQADNNSWLIKQAVEALQAATGKTISSATATGNQLTITYTDATTDIITLPTATWTWRGEWDAGTSYAVNDLFSESGTIYLVLVAHTAATSFDAGETSTATGDLYQKILDFPAIPGYERTGTTFTPELADANSWNVCTSASGCTVIIDPSIIFPAWTEIHIRDETKAGGGVTVEGVTGVTITTPEGYLPTAACKGATLSLKKFGSTDEWHLMGLLAVETTA